MADEITISARLDDNVSSALGQIEKALGKTGKEAATGGSAFAGLGKQVLGAAAGFGVFTGAQAAVTAGLTATIGAAMDFEQALANVGAATGASAADMKELRAESLKVGAETSKSASEVVEAFGELAKAGTSVGDIVGGVGRIVVNMSEATGAAVSEMATLLSNSLNTFGASAGDASRYADMIVKSANASAIGVGDFAQSLQAVGPVAKLAGLSMDDLSRVIGIAGNNALRGSDAGTSLKTMLTSLAAPSKTARAEMEKLGIALHSSSGATLPFRDVLGQLQRALGGATEAQKAASLATIFGQDAIRISTILLKEGTTGWDKFGQSMANAPSVAEQAATRLDTTRGAIERLKGSMETIGIAIGSTVLPALANLITGIDQLISQANQPIKFVVSIEGPDGTPIGTALKNIGEMAVLGIPGVRLMFTAINMGAKESAKSLEQVITPMEKAIPAWAKLIAAQEAETQKTRDAIEARLQHQRAMSASLAVGAEWASILSDIADKVKKGGDAFAEAAGQIDKLTSAVTQAELTMNRQVSALESVGSAAATMASSMDPAAIETWSQRAREMVAAADLAPEKLAAITRELDIIEQGGPGVASALDRINKLIKDAKKPLEDGQKATRDYAEAQGDMAKESMGLGGSLDALNSTLKSFVDAFMAEIGRVPVSAKDAATLTEKVLTIDMSKPGADVAASYANKLGAETIRLVNAEGTEIITVVKGVMSIDLANEGAVAGASFAKGIASQVVNVYNAGKLIATTAIGAVQETLQQSSPSKVMIASGEFAGIGFAKGLDSTEQMAATSGRKLAQAGISGVSKELQAAAPGIAQYAATLNSLNSGPMRDLQRQANEAQSELIALRRELAGMDQKSEGAKAIKERISELTSLRSEIFNTIRSIKLAETALDSFNARMAQIVELPNVTRMFGAAGDVPSLLANLLIGDETGAGDAVAEAAGRLLERAREVGIQGTEALAADLRDIVPAALASGDITPVLTWFADLQARITATGTLTGETWATATATAVENSGLAERLGSEGMRVWDALQTQLRDGSQANIAALAQYTSDYVNTLRTNLPPGLFAEHEAAIWAAANLVAADGSAENQAILQGALAAAQAARVNYAATLRALPEDLADLPAITQEILGRLKAAFDAGLITEQQFVAQSQAQIRLLGDTYRELPGFVQAAIDEVAGALERGEVNVRQATQQINALTASVPKAFEDWPEPVQQAFRELWQAYQRGEIDLKDFNQRVALVSQYIGQNFHLISDAGQTALAGIGISVLHMGTSVRDGSKAFERAMEAISDAGKNTATDIHVAMQMMINDFAKGLISAEQLAEMMSKLQGAASAAASAGGSRGGSGGGDRESGNDKAEWGPGFNLPGIYRDQPGALLGSTMWDALTRPDVSFGGGEGVDLSGLDYASEDDDNDGVIMMDGEIVATLVDRRIAKRWKSIGIG